jgi:hypothetical protein
MAEVPNLYSAAFDEGSCVNVLEAGANGCKARRSGKSVLVLVRSQLESARCDTKSMSSGEEEALRVSERHRTFMAMTALAVWTGVVGIVSDVYGWTELTGQTPSVSRFRLETLRE